MSDIDVDELAGDLPEFDVPEKSGGRSRQEERIIAGFEEIQAFVEKHGRAPLHGADRDIFERIYAVRLDRLRALAECRAILEPLDHQNLLAGDAVPTGLSAGDVDVDDLAQELSGGDNADLTALRHVRASSEKRAAQEIADRTRCRDFDAFKPLFDKAQCELAEGIRTARPFVRDAGFSKAEIKQGQFFILGGQTAYVAAMGEPIKAPNGETDARLRVIYSNGTESDLLLRSLQRALYKDDGGRRISEPVAGPLFADRSEDGDESSGTLYVLRSRSTDPRIAAHREVLHKIGVTGGSVERRIANAALDATYLMAEVDVVATYELFNVDRTRLENLIHRIFGAARLDVTITDRLGNPIVPREWFLVPLAVIDAAVERIRDGTITDYRYDVTTARLLK